MAETIVDLVVSKFQQEYGLTFSPCKTKHMPISGGHVGGSERFPSFIEEKVNLGVNLGLNRERAYSLVHKYGSNIDKPL